ncbi:MAG: ABC transporter permease [Anaerolineales bacterium]|nr:ABC transporter permease [Anaerolineales bacterium]
MILLRYTLRRLLLMIVVLLGISILAFTITHLIPSSPAAMWIGERATQEQIDRVNEEMGFNKPIYVQYWLYMKNLSHGDLGVSLRTKQPVRDELVRRFSATFELVTLSLFVAVLVGVPLGILSATHKDTWGDRISRLVSISGVSLPSFFLAMLLQLAFASNLHIMPLQGRIDSEILSEYPFAAVTGFYLIDPLLAGNWIAFKSSLSHLILPVFAMAFTSLGIVTRISRSSMIEILTEDYVRTAHAYGLSRPLVEYKYALKNALLPVITVLGLSYGYMLGGTFFIESMFDLPGLGHFCYTSIIRNDFPAVMGVTLLYAASFILVNLLVDLIYFAIDPRIRLKPKGN